MATNLALDDKLILEAQTLGRHKSKKEAVNTALRDYIAHKRQMELSSLFETVDIDPSYDYKKAREGKGQK